MLRQAGPGDEIPWRERLIPQLHARYWYPEDNAALVYDDLLTNGIEQAVTTLEHAEAIASAAVDRAAAADRRATTIAGAVAIAASFTLSGGALILDRGKIIHASMRIWFAVLLGATTVFFVLSALYALRALVATRAWNWSNPMDLPHNKAETRDKQIGMRAAHLLVAFGGNWEISELKNDNVNNALKCLLSALCGIAAFAVLLIVDVA
jgi:hypothetical protein